MNGSRYRNMPGAFHLTEEQCCLFIEAKFCNPHFRSSPQMRDIKRGTPLSSVKTKPVIINHMESVPGWPRETSNSALLCVVESTKYCISIF